MSPTSRNVLLLALGIVSACAGKSTSTDVTPSSSGVITRAEMEQVEHASLYDVVQALRGRWLQTRGPKTLMGRPAEIQVFLDDLRLGGVDALRSLTTDNVASISFIDPVEAGQRWGGKYAQGSIVVATRADAAPSTKRDTTLLR
jgi:hypothetical protein